MQLRLVPFLLLIAKVFAVCLTAYGELKASDTEWYTGDSLQSRLQVGIGVTWKSTPLRHGIANLSRNQQVCIWLDRRIDPGQRIDFTANGETLDTTLKRLAASVGCGMGSVDSVIYIGPRRVANNLATVAALRRDDANALPPAAKTRWLRKAPWSWKRLAVPGELVANLAEEAGIRVVNLEVIPHDLWPAGDLPPLPVVDRLSLVLAGFGLSFEISRDGSAIRLSAMPESAEVTRTLIPKGNVDRVLAQVQEVFPAVKLRRVGNRVSATGRYEDVEKVRRLLRGEQIARREGGETRFDLAVENTPAGAIVKEVARRMGYEVQVDAAVRDNLSELVSIRVEKATAEELLSATLEPASIRFRLRGKVLQLLPAQ